MENQIFAILTLVIIWYLFYRFGKWLYYVSNTFFKIIAFIFFSLMIIQTLETKQYNNLIFISALIFEHLKQIFLFLYNKFGFFGNWGIKLFRNLKNIFIWIFTIFPKIINVLKPKPTLNNENEAFKDFERDYNSFKDKFDSDRQRAREEDIRFQREKQKFEQYKKTHFNSRKNENKQQQAKPKSSKSFSDLDPYEILGVSKNSSKAEIKKAWLTKMKEYHPDKVGNLGEKLRVLAEEESKKINWAWDRLK